MSVSASASIYNTVCMCTFKCMSYYFVLCDVLCYRYSGFWKMYALRAFCETVIFGRVKETRMGGEKNRNDV